MLRVSRQKLAVAEKKAWKLDHMSKYFAQQEMKYDKLKADLDENMRMAE